MPCTFQASWQRSLFGFWALIDMPVYLILAGIGLFFMPICAPPPQNSAFLAAQAFIDLYKTEHICCSDAQGMRQASCSTAPSMHFDAKAILVACPARARFGAPLFLPILHEGGGMNNARTSAATLTHQAAALNTSARQPVFAIKAICVNA